MTFFCSSCGTESPHREICSDCGSLMVELTDKHLFALEIIDQVISRAQDETVIFERRGPFNSANEAKEWWGYHHTLKRYKGCTAEIVVLEPPVNITDPSTS